MGEYVAKLQIHLGPKPTKQHVDALPFLPGLLFHRPPGKAKKHSTTYTITHVRSGLFVLDEVEESILEVCRMILGRIDWDKDKNKIYDDETYDIVIREALSIMDTKKASLRQEKRLAKDLEGRTQPGSGSVWGFRRDVRTPTILIEAKTTTLPKYSLSVRDLTYLTHQAYSDGKVPAYVVEFNNIGEIAILPTQDLGEDFIKVFSSLKDLPLRKKSPKSISLTKKHLQELFLGTALQFAVENEKYTIMEYSKFLEFAKRGI